MSYIHAVGSQCGLSDLPICSGNGEDHHVECTHTNSPRSRANQHRQWRSTSQTSSASTGQQLPRIQKQLNEFLKRTICDLDRCTDVIVVAVVGGAETLEQTRYAENPGLAWSESTGLRVRSRPRRCRPSRYHVLWNACLGVYEVVRQNCVACI